MSTSNIAVIGDRDSVLGFKALGTAVFPICNDRPQEALDIIEKLCHERYAVVFITEPIAQKIETELSRYRYRTLPSIVLIPNNQGSIGLGRERVRDTVKRAVGIDIFREEAK
ncbi:MAG: V-type ATP synthase subunit F [Deltaproteobacteria bacterium]|nr:MAG: V-type ATP synthase subunit F [Deltaproteobacteria bacterium]